MARPSIARRRPRPDRAASRAAVAVGASLAVNAALLAALGAAGAFTLPPPAPRVALAPVPPEVWAANRRIAVGATPPAAEATLTAAPAPPARAAPVAAPEPPAAPIVEVAPSKDGRRPRVARFLAERDNTVPRDVQHRLVPERPGPVAERPTSGAPGGGIPLPGEEGTREESAPGRAGEAGGGSARIAAARLALAPDGESSADGRPPADSALAFAGERGARRLGRFDPRLLPVGDRFAGAGGGSPMAERLPGVEEADATRLNTRAFKYADFYRRVAEAIRSEWDPNRAWDGLDPHGRIYGRAARRVAVDIVLDRDGRLVEATVAASSGLPFFDREALRAIDAAAPFPNPPEGLVDREGRVVLARYGLRFDFPGRAGLDRLLRAGAR